MIKSLDKSENLSVCFDCDPMCQTRTISLAHWVTTTYCVGEAWNRERFAQIGKVSYENVYYNDECLFSPSEKQVVAKNGEFICLATVFWAVNVMIMKAKKSLVAWLVSSQLPFPFFMILHPKNWTIFTYSLTQGMNLNSTITPLAKPVWKWSCDIQSNFCRCCQQFGVVNNWIWNSK